MTSDKYIFYKADYKYQLSKDFSFNTSIMTKKNIKTDFIYLDMNGNLLVKKGYAWDGPSGPVIDTDKNMRASLVHDAIYHLMRNEHLIKNNNRKATDQLFKKTFYKR